MCLACGVKDIPLGAFALEYGACHRNLNKYLAGSQCGGRMRNPETAGWDLNLYQAFGGKLGWLICLQTGV